MKIGFIGIGQMGSRMALHVLKAGFNLTVFDRRKEAAQSLLDKGVAWADSPKEIARTCEVVLTSLPEPPDVQSVVYGPNGLISGWKRGDIYIDMSTNSPTVVRDIAVDAGALGVGVLDAPVSGGVTGAEAGTLAIMVGGEKAHLDKAMAVLKAMGKNIFHVGDIGCGNVAKLVNNLISLTCSSITAEAFVLGTKAGIDPHVLWQVTRAGTAANWNLEQFERTVLKGDFEPGFRLSLGCKDIALAMQLGREYGVPLSIGAATEQEMIETKTAGYRDKSVTAVVMYLEKLVGVNVRKK